MHGTLPPRRRIRIVRRDDSWTYNEAEALKLLWPDMKQIKAKIPYRSELAIRAMAKRCGLIPDSNRHVWTAAEEKKLRDGATAGKTQREIANALGLSVFQVAKHMQLRRIHIKRRAPAAAQDPLADAIRQRAFQLKMSIADLDRSMGRRHTFANARGNKHVNPTHIHRAVKALGGHLTVVWDDAQ